MVGTEKRVLVVIHTATTFQLDYLNGTAEQVLSA